MIQAAASVAAFVAHRLTSIARVFHSVVGSSTEHCRTKVSVVDEVNITRAATNLSESSGLTMHKSGQMMIEAVETVIVDGEHILMG